MDKNCLQDVYKITKNLRNKVGIGQLEFNEIIKDIGEIMKENNQRKAMNPKEVGNSLRDIFSKIKESN